MSEIVIEQRGGYVGAGSALGKFKTEGRVTFSSLSKDDQGRVDALFSRRKKIDANLFFHLRRNGPNGMEETDALPEELPAALTSSVSTTIE